MIAAAVLVVIATGFIVVALMNSHETGNLPSPGTGVQANPSAPAITGTPAAAVSRSRIANSSEANPLPTPRNGSSGSDDNPMAVSPTNLPAKKGSDACIMVPAGDGFVYEDNSVFNAGSAGTYSSPVAKKDGGITEEQAEDLARKAFPHNSPDRIDTEYVDGSQNTRAWKFSQYKDDKQLVLGMLYADTGDLMGYSIPYGTTEALGTSSPVTTMESARTIAEKEIRERNGEIPLRLLYEEVNRDGNYLFSYHRILRGIPCSKDSVYAIIDSGTGTVIRYSKIWYVPENAVTAQTVPAVSREEATALVEEKSTACYPGSAAGFRIISAELEWKDLYNADEFTPLPGAIPLTWHVRFDDEKIRAQKFPVPGEGWVDAQNGTLLSLYYVHRPG
jgi:hypothetical protein